MGTQFLASRLAALPLARVLAVTVAASVLIYAALAISFFPTAYGTLGHDYEYFLPLLLAGKYWVMQNGFLAVPRFSPAFCAGVPFLANPQSMFYSVPQALALLTDPVTSYRLTTLLFTATGAIGTYFLMTRRFGVSTAAAMLSSVVFMFNGFLMYRMAVGHVTYHVVGLLPALCCFLLTSIPAEGPTISKIRQAAGAVVGSAAILAYFVYAGAPNMLAQLAIICIAVWLIHGLVRPAQYSFWLIGGAAGILAAAMGAAKLVPAMAWLAEFPRPHTIELVGNLPALLASLMRGLFFPASLPVENGRHEWEFGVGLVPLFLLVRGARLGGARFGLKGVAAQSAARWARISALSLLMLLPIWLNYGDAEKAAWLKTLPYVGDNVILVRWFSVYILPLTVAAGCLLDFVFPDTRARFRAAILGIIVTAAQPLLSDRSYYQQQPYEPGLVLAASQATDLTGRVPAVAAIASIPGAGRNDGLAWGRTSYPCYEPMFGYRSETFPGTPVPGPLFSSASGAHLRNPACYIYGEANGCKPGAEFTDAERQNEVPFAAYRPFGYELPAWQIWADRLSLLALAIMLMGAGIAFGAWLPIGSTLKTDAQAARAGERFQTVEPH
jgi:hypothetical protein